MAQELTKSERIRIMIRNIFGYYVVERILMRSSDNSVTSFLCEEISKNLAYLGNKQLKAKWIDLIDKCKKQELVFVESKNLIFQRNKDRT